MELFSYTASPWLVLYSTGLFHPSDCLILEWLYQWMYSPARSMTSSHVRSSQCSGYTDSTFIRVFSQVGVSVFVRYFFRFWAWVCRPGVFYWFWGLPNMSAWLMRWLCPVNSMSRPWWTMRSMIEAASLSSAKIVPHLLNSMFVVKMMLLLS